MTSAVENKALAQVIHFNVICFSVEDMWGEFINTMKREKLLNYI